MNRTPPHGMAPNQLAAYIENLSGFGVVINILDGGYLPNRYDLDVQMITTARDSKGVVGQVTMRSKFDFSISHISDVHRGLLGMLERFERMIEEKQEKEVVREMLKKDMFGPDNALNDLFRRVGELEEQRRQERVAMEGALDVLEGLVAGNQTAVHVINIIRSSIGEREVV